ncbi:MAG: hypothetical protein ACFFAO_08300 [Candidatus Hermodarchaeota archaeon]
MTIFLINLIFVSKVVAAEYNLELAENKTLIWKVDTFDEDTYERIFAKEADFDEDEQKQIKITAIDKRDTKWVISYDQWDYTDDTSDFSGSADDDKTKAVYKNPDDLDHKILEIEDITKLWVVPSPYINYIEEFENEFDNQIIDVSIEDDKLIAEYAIENPGFQIEISYTNDGLAEKIEYIDDDGDTFVKIVLLQEEIIPGYPPLLLLPLIFGAVIVIVWRKRVNMRIN